MNLFRLSLGLLAVSVFAADHKLDDLLQQVENRYNSAKTLQVQFTEQYTPSGGIRRTESGTLMLRKPGKLPYQTVRATYALEYGTGVLEAHVDAVTPGEKVAVVDDLLATGGTAWGAGELVRQQAGVVGAYVFVIELAFLKGRSRLNAPVEALISY